MRILLFVCMLLLTACTSASANAASTEALQPYATITAASTATPAIFIPETPIPTVTPSTYVIQQGDTLSQLAEKFHLSPDDLQALNPDIDPKNLTIGMTILVPGSPLAAAGSFTPTPVPVPVSQVACHPTANNGLWCFVLMQNTTNEMLENVYVQITLVDASGAAIATQLAGLPLDILPANTSEPAYAYFLDVPQDAIPQVQLMSALPVSAGDPRYLSTTLDNTLAQINWDGRSAQVSGQVFLPAGSTAAAAIWVAAVAYDKTGQVVGVKRWDGGGIQPGTSIPFNFAMASVGPRIDSVEFMAEARP